MFEIIFDLNQRFSYFFKNPKTLLRGFDKKIIENNNNNLIANLT
jgi:hypothetical protein